MRLLLFIFIFCFLFPGLARANNVPDIIINEVAWMGTLTSANDEWIELFNQSDAVKSIDGWLLKAADDSPKINLKGTMLPKSFWLLERTDDNTITEVSADQIYTGALNNGGEALGLYDNTGKLIDSAAEGNIWPAGDNSTKQTMERSGPQSWQTSRNAEGTPKAKNGAPVEAITRPALPLPPTEQLKATNVQKKPEEINVSNNIAAVGEQIPQTRSFSTTILLTALLLAAFSGTTILMLKKRLK